MTNPTDTSLKSEPQPTTESTEGVAETTADKEDKDGDSSNAVEPKGGCMTDDCRDTGPQ
ncbi:MAG: hypothetical protein HUU21_32995 [Polyangiaceae bacterium]|nr:hypothetical protein [Polyangiaceae bacterium]NUQ78373.1 hypothetical protein [Polyangiaceae bacterium]